MARLIDAKGKFVLNARDYTGHIICFENGYATVFDRFAKAICKFSILDAPAVDAVPVVRCKDCKHYRKDSFWCDMNSKDRGEWFNWYPEDFCSYGERRTE